MKKTFYFQNESTNLKMVLSSFNLKLQVLDQNFYSKAIICGSVRYIAIFEKLYKFQSFFAFKVVGTDNTYFVQ